MVSAQVTHGVKMDAQIFIDSLNLPLLLAVFGLMLTVWCAGYATGHSLAFVRKITHQAT
jgi:hypothetical protein